MIFNTIRLGMPQAIIILPSRKNKKKFTELPKKQNVKNSPGLRDTERES